MVIIKEHLLSTSKVRLKLWPADVHSRIRCNAALVPVHLSSLWLICVLLWLFSSFWKTGCLINTTESEGNGRQLALRCWERMEEEEGVTGQGWRSLSSPPSAAQGDHSLVWAFLPQSQRTERKPRQGVCRRCGRGRPVCTSASVQTWRMAHRDHGNSRHVIIIWQRLYTWAVELRVVISSKSGVCD